MVDRLREHGYTENGVSQAMGVVEHSRRDWQGWPAHIRNCRRQMDTSPCAVLTAFFLIEGLLDRELLMPLLGSEILGALHDLQWIVAVDGKLHFRYFLYPLLDSFILTDGYSSNPPSNFDQVYHLGADSHLLARLAPRPKVHASLDHCTGSGVHAVLGGAHSQHGFGLDINPRALQFARLNAKLNRRPNVRFLESDCYAVVTPGQQQFEDCPAFDLVTANPPFVPTPEALSLCRGGGLSGEEVTEKIIRGLPQMLSGDGIFSMITNIPVFRNQTFFHRCENWLDSSDSWGMVVLSNYVWSLESYVLSHQRQVSHQDYGQHFEVWLDAYEGAELEAVTSSQVYLFRSAHPWRIERSYQYPNDSVSRFIEQWIVSLRSFATGARYRLHPGLDKVWWLDDHTRVYLEWAPEFSWWRSQGLWLEGPAAKALAQIQSHPENFADQWDCSEALDQLLQEHLLTVSDPSTIFCR
jgi:carbamoyltransferase